MNYIKYKDQELPIAIDFAVIKTICNKLNMKLSDIENLIDSPASTEKLTFEALKRGAKLEGTEFSIKENEVEDILSETYGDFLQVFNKSVVQMFKPSAAEEKKS